LAYQIFGDPMIQMNRLIRCGTLGLILLSLPWTLSAAAVQIKNNVPLTFGNLISGSTSGTVKVSSSGAATTTGGVIAFGGGSAPASFTISIEKGNPHYTIQLSGGTSLVGPGASMPVDLFESTPPAGGGRISPPAGFEDMTVGATLHVGANQAAGMYSGTFDVTVTSP
jgi:hypothetical protein